MRRIKRPDQIDNERLREFAERAVWVARMSEAYELMDDLCTDQHWARKGFEGERDDARIDFVPILEEDLHCISAMVLDEAWNAASTSLEEDLAAWLAQDPEHWGIFKLVIFDPWWHPSNRWRKKTPDWVITLSTETIIAHFHPESFEG